MNFRNAVCNKPLTKGEDNHYITILPSINNKTSLIYLFMCLICETLQKYFLYTYYYFCSCELII